MTLIFVEGCGHPSTTQVRISASASVGSQHVVHRTTLAPHASIRARFAKRISALFWAAEHKSLMSDRDRIQGALCQLGEKIQVVWVYS